MIYWKYKKLTPDECREQYPDLYTQIESEFPHLLSKDLAKILSLMVGACKHCLSDDIRCTCWRNE